MDDLDWISKEFWEPVRVTVPEEYFIFESILGGWDCVLCGQSRTDRTRLKCCRNHVCKICTTEWFVKKSTKCPFCKGDVREKRVQNPLNHQNHTS